MEGLLTRVSTSYKKPSGDVVPALVEVTKPQQQVSRPGSRASTPAEALEILKNEPDYDSLISTLRFLLQITVEFNISSPSPEVAQVVHVLVTETVPNYWDVLRKSPRNKSPKHGNLWLDSDLGLLVSCLRSVTGLNAILLGLKQHIRQSKETKKSLGGANTQAVVTVLLQVLQATLEGNTTINIIWESIYGSSEPTAKENALWQEFITLIGGGKMLSISAEAEDVINSVSTSIGEKHWVANGSRYSLWLARNISYWANALGVDSDIGFTNCSLLLGKSLRLGHTDIVLKELLDLMILQRNEHKEFRKLIGKLPSFEQRNVLYSLIKIISRDYISSSMPTEDNNQWWLSDATNISAAACLIKLLLDGEESRKGHLISWLTNSSGAGVGDGIAIRRAVIACITPDKADIETVLEKSMQQFGDQLYIRHTPTLQQEVHAQILLLAAGSLHRQTPLRLAMMMRSGTYLNVVSNRLASSSPRARFLGMVVGEALSSLVDKGDKKMDFKVEEMRIAEAKWYKSLVNVADTIGTLDSLKAGPVAPQVQRLPSRTAKSVAKPNSASSGSKIITIEEIETDEEELDSENDGLTPYEKPDSDMEDSDEDATLITRNKPTAPVYIRDLITYLRDTENYDRQKLGLTTAAPLIRRKANFGTEVSGHAEELATLLVGLQDKYEIENFQDMRLQAMIAILFALPEKMGQWLAKTFFDGDYSLSQRASVLTTLGLGARELAGFGAEDQNASLSKEVTSSFPSKTLLPAMHNVYASPSPKDSEPHLKSTARPQNRSQNDNNAISLLTHALSNTMIAPLASSASKIVNGPALLQTRQFSTRLAVAAARKKPTTNTLAKIVSTSFFFPLTGRFCLLLSSSRGSSFPALSSPFLLAHFLKTLALLLHASGPNTLSLPQMTAEFWDLLLALRIKAQGDIAVMEGLLFSFLTILEINEDKRRLVEAQGRQLLETQEWAEGVFSRLGITGSSGIDGLMGGGGGHALSEEDDRVRMLVAAVLVRIRECVEKYQALLMGDLASY